MQFLIDFVDSISSMFQGVWDFLSHMFQSYITVYKYIGNGVKLAYNLISSLPVWLTAFGLATIGVSVVFVILGWSTGGKKSG